MHRTLIIIGSGPAGLTAALYAARAQLEPLVLAGAEAGGQLMLTTEVENFPTHEQILGPQLMDKMRKHAERFGAEIHPKTVAKVDFTLKPFRLWTDEAEYTADAVIVATGASAKWLELDSETRLRGKGVSSCATCDGFFFKNKELAVIGGGDTALEEATFLTKFATQVTVVHRRDSFRASKPLQDRARQNPKIKYCWNSEVLEILGDQRVSGLRLKDVITGAESTLSVDGVFVAIGHQPNTQIFVNQLELDEKGYVKAIQRTRTNVEGVFVAGDVEDSRYRQAITAAGAGCQAAMDAEKWLAERSGKQ